MDISDSGQIEVEASGAVLAFVEDADDSSKLDEVVCLEKRYILHMTVSL
jgi:hypothetical protein